MPTRHHTDRSARPTSPPGRGHRLGFLLGAATLGAVAVALIAPNASAATGITADAGARNAAARILSTEQAASRGTVRAPIAEQDATQSLPAAQAADALAQKRVRALNDPHNHPSAVSAVTITHSPASDAASPPNAGPAGPNAYRAYAQSKVSAAQFSCLDALWTKESGWRATAHNHSSTAYGIPQLLDTTWAATGIAMTSNGYRQVDAGLAYIRAAYGAPCSAWAHSQATNWY